MLFHFMTRKENLQVVKPFTSVDEALEALVDNRITGFPVVDDDWKLVGVRPYCKPHFDQSIKLHNSRASALLSPPPLSALQTKGKLHLRSLIQSWSRTQTLKDPQGRTLRPYFTDGHSSP